MKKIFFIIFLIAGNLLQSQSIEGFVYSVANNEPLQGVTIKIQNQNLGVVTDNNGFFSLIVPTIGEAVLQFSHLGYADTSLVIAIKTGMNKMNIFLKQKQYELGMVFITASRHEQKSADIPARIQTIDKAEIETTSFTNVDEFLLLAAGVHTDRDFGIFSRNAGVTMRGLNSTARVLILQDGLPLNKADGGGINWNRINAKDIEKIEILKGPASAIYGGNAMAGVINIISKKPQEKLGGAITTSIGSYNTFGVHSGIWGKQEFNQHQFYWTTELHKLKGEGYEVSTEALASVYDTTVFIDETGLSGLMGFAFNKNNVVELRYRYWDDVRSDGIRVYTDYGSYNKYTTHAASLRYQKKFGKTDWTTQFNYQFEDYFRQNESVGKKNNKFRMYDNLSERLDYGVFSSFLTQVNPSLNLIYGIDAKQGKINASEIYYTSTDVTNKKGQMNQYAAFFSAEKSFLNKKWILSLGGRYDYVMFSNGAFAIETPSQLTAFIENYPINFSDKQWNAISPKAGIKYFVNKKITTYASYAVGYRPAMLDDITTNRSITKGFKIANSNLAPEFLHNYECGLNWNILSYLSLETSIYHAAGQGFHYFVFTGDSVDAGTEALKAVIIRDNIAKVKVYGIENSLSWNILKSLTLKINYAYNYSFIAAFKNSKYENKDLNNKFLMEVPPHQLNAYINYRYKNLSASASFHYIDEQWSDDENINFTPSYHYVNTKLNYKISKNFNSALTIHNVLNEKFVNNKGELCPGTFVLLEVQYLFSLFKNNN